MVAAWLYPAFGAFTLAVAIPADGQRGAIGVVAAWAICGVPLLFDSLRRAVANRRAVDTTNTTRGLKILPPGMLFRSGFVLFGSALLYHLAKDWLGIGYWFAVVVFYQTALAVVVLRSWDPSGSDANRADLT